MVEKSQDKEMNKSVAVGNVENNSEKHNTNPIPYQNHEFSGFMTPYQFFTFKYIISVTDNAISSFQLQKTRKNFPNLSPK